MLRLCVNVRHVVCCLWQKRHAGLKVKSRILFAHALEEQRATFGADDDTDDVANNNTGIPCQVFCVSLRACADAESWSTVRRAHKCETHHTAQRVLCAV